MNIETGCLAIVIKGSHTGLEVKVGDFIGKIKGWTGEHRWKVDKKLRTKYKLYGDYCNHIEEHWLMRIDGYKETIKEREVAA